MYGQLNRDRIFSLADLNAYPGNNKLDRIIQLFSRGDARRRIWLLAPEGSPTIFFDRMQLEPQTIAEGPLRWIDYGVAELPKTDEDLPTWDGFLHLNLLGLPLHTCAASYLVITPKLDLSLAGLTLEEAQRALWGIAQRELGTTTITPSRVTVGAPETYVVRYRAGEKGLPADALVQFAVAKAMSLPQIDRRGEPGFTELVEGADKAKIVSIRDMLETHEKNGIICRLERDLAPGEGFSLSYSTTSNYIYPQIMDETELRTWYTKLPPLSAGVAVAPDAGFVSLRPQDGHTVTYEVGPSERLHLFLPGRRFASETLSVRGLFTDHFRNVPPSDIIDADILLYLVSEHGRTELGAPAGCFTERHRFQMTLPALAPGIYRVEARRRADGAFLAVSNPLQVIADGSGERLYWGEIHCHTEMSDGSGDFSNVYRHARDEGCLEFATVTDHAEYFSDNQWRWMQDVINRWNEPGRFVTLVGYEWIGKQADRIVYTSRDSLPLLRGDDPRSENLNDLWGRFHDDPQVVGGPHATLVHQTIWEQHDPTVERYAEIYSMWGSCDFRDSPLVAPWIGPDRGITVNDILQRGAKLGFTAGGDCHDGRVGFTSEDPDGQGVTPHTFAAIILYRCGMTAANMPELTREALVTALRQRRTYATTGARMLLDFQIEDLNMGAEGEVDRATCRATIHAVAPLERVEIVKDGAVVWKQDAHGLDITVSWEDPQAPVGEHYYYLHVVQKDEQRAWSSPIWVRPRITARRQATPERTGANP